MLLIVRNSGTYLEWFKIMPLPDEIPEGELADAVTNIVDEEIPGCAPTISYNAVLQQGTAALPSRGLIALFKLIWTGKAEVK